MQCGWKSAWDECYFEAMTPKGGPSLQAMSVLQGFSSGAPAQADIFQMLASLQQTVAAPATPTHNIGPTASPLSARRDGEGRGAENMFASDGDARDAPPEGETRDGEAEADDAPALETAARAVEEAAAALVG